MTFIVLIRQSVGDHDEKGLFWKCSEKGKFDHQSHVREKKRKHYSFQYNKDLADVHCPFGWKNSMHRIINKDVKYNTPIVNVCTWRWTRVMTDLLGVPKRSASIVQWCMDVQSETLFDIHHDISHLADCWAWSSRGARQGLETMI